MSSLSKVSAIGFDLDGTLINSANGIYKSYLYATTLLGINPKPKDLVITKIGPPIDIFFLNLHPDKSSQIQNYAHLFKEHYLRIGYQKTELKVKALALLELINELKIKSFILTNKSRASTEKILTLFKIKNFFSEIICITQNSLPSNNKVCCLSDCKKKYLTDNQLMVYIGDTYEDLNAAAANQIPFIGLRDGYGKFQDYEEGSNRIYRDISELLEIEFSN